MTAAVDNSSLTNRYNVAEVPISSLVAYPSNNVAPTLSNINKIVVSAKVGSSDNGYYWIALDGLRIDNISSNTATYDMVAYSQIKNYAPLASNPSTTYATPIVKDANSSNFVEFRFGFGV
jgi:hypothetical protein